MVSISKLSAMFKALLCRVQVIAVHDNSTVFKSVIIDCVKIMYSIFNMVMYRYAFAELRRHKKLSACQNVSTECIITLIIMCIRSMYILHLHVFLEVLRKHR